YTTFGSSALHAGKINTELGRNSARDRRRFHPCFLGLIDFRRWLFRFSFLFCLWWGRCLFLLLRFRCRRFFFWLLRLLRLLFFLFFFFGFWLFLFFFLLFFLFLFFVFFLVFSFDVVDSIALVFLSALFV